MSQITTHILDTSKGKPASGVSVQLYKNTIAGWDSIAEGLTNEDGRIPGLLDTSITLQPGFYKLHFDTGSYFTHQQTKGFYPFVEIVFEITSNQHYHVPLLLNQFGYSTYRGS
jgi:5-hydroxyisourate hydrolase